MLFSHTVQANIKAIRSDPHIPLREGADTGCVRAGGSVKIVCESEDFSAVTVEFWKDNSPLDPTTNDR